MLVRAAAIALALALTPSVVAAQSPPTSPASAPSPAARPAPMTDPCLPAFGPVVTAATTSASAAVGQPFIVALRGTPSAGYSWSLSPLGAASAFFTLDGTQPVSDVSFRNLQNPAAPPMVGGNATQLWMFTPKAAGTAILTFTYGRGFATPGTVRPARSFTIHVAAGSAAVC